MLTRYQKKYEDDIMELNDCITIINRLCSLFPGAPAPAFNETKCKNFLFNMMLRKWQTAYCAQGHNWGDPAVTRDNLVQYFQAQQAVMNDSDGHKCKANSSQSPYRYNRYQRNNLYARGGRSPSRSNIKSLEDH